MYLKLDNSDLQAQVLMDTIKKEKNKKKIYSVIGVVRPSLTWEQNLLMSLLYDTHLYHNYGKK